MALKLYKNNKPFDGDFNTISGEYHTSYDVSDHSLTINSKDDKKGIKSVAELYFSTQVILEEAFELFQKFETEIVSIRYVEDNTNIDLSNVTFPKSIKYLEIDIFDSKKAKVNLLSAENIQLENLRVLQLKANYAYEFNQFYAIPNLKQLQVSYRKKALGWMDLDGLVDLRIDSFKEENLHSLHKLKSLKRLSIFGGSIKSLDGIENLTNLEALTIFNTRSLHSVDALLLCDSIVSLEFDRYKNISDWGFLKGMKQLRWLRVRVAESFDWTLENPNLIAFSQEILNGSADFNQKMEQRYLALSKKEQEQIQFNFYNGSKINYHE